MSFACQLRRYIRDRAKVLLLLAGMVALFALTIALYRLPLAAVGYAAALSASLGLVMGALDFYRYLRKQRLMISIRSEIIDDLDNLPDPSGQMEENMRRMLEALFDEKAALRAQHRKQRDDMLAYYSLWVHQIKTPIAALRLMIQGGQMEEKHLASELNKIEQYVQMALYYMRLENGGSDYVFGRVSLDAILRKSIKQHAAQFIGKNVSLEYAGVNEYVMTDEKWLCFALGQIISNAIKYTNDGKIAITWEEPSTLVITDTGLGIQGTDLPRIFEAGYTGYNGRVEQRSTGLGLYLCKRVMDNLSHQISIESSPHRGTKVCVSFSQREAFAE